MGLTCERASVVRARLIYVYKDGGTHALVAEPRQDLERRAAEIRVE